MDVNLQIGKKLKLIRIDRDLSQGELAELIGLTGSRVSDMERGKYKFTMEMLDKLCEALQVHRADLIGNLEDETGIYMVISGLEKEKKIKLKDILNKIKSLDVSDMEKVNDFMDLIKKN
jgi:putative transcriptional regulator